MLIFRPSWLGRPFLWFMISGGFLSVPVKKEGQSLRIVVEESDFEAVRVEKAEEDRGLPYPDVIATPVSSPAVLLDSQLAQSDELVLRTLENRGDRSDDGSRFFISWEAQIPYRGQARDRILELSTLYLHELEIVAE